MTKVEDNKHSKITGLGDIIYEPEGEKAEAESVISRRCNCQKPLAYYLQTVFKFLD